MDEEPREVVVTVKTLFDDVDRKLRVFENSTCLDIKKVIRVKTGVPVCYQKLLIANGSLGTRELENDENAPRDGEVLHLRLREVKGGCEKECCGCVWYGPIFSFDCGG